MAWLRCSPAAPAYFQWGKEVGHEAREIQTPAAGLHVVGEGAFCLEVVRERPDRLIAAHVEIPLGILALVDAFLIHGYNCPREFSAFLPRDGIGPQRDEVYV